MIVVKRDSNRQSIGSPSIGVATKCDTCHEQGPVVWSFHEPDGFDRLAALRAANMVERLDGRYLRQHHQACAA